MKQRPIFSLMLLAFLLLAACSQAPAEENIPTETPEVAESASSTPAPTASPQPTTSPTATPTETPLPTATPDPAPVVDLRDMELPYLQDGGALPPGALARIGIGDVRSVAMGENGLMWLATDTGVYAYDTPNMERVWRNYLSDQPLYVRLSPDGTRLTVGFGWTGRPLLFDAATGERMAELDGWDDPVWSFDGQMIAVEDRPSWPTEDDALSVGGLSIYDGHNGVKIKSLETELEHFYGPAFELIRWSQSGKEIAACGEDQLFVWNVISGELQTTVPLPKGYFCNFEFSPDDTAIIVSNGMVVDVASGEKLYEGESSNTWYWTEDSLVLCRSVFTSRTQVKKELNIVQMQDWQVSQVLEGLGPCVLSPDGQQVVLSTLDSLKIADARTLEIQLVIPNESAYSPHSIKWSPDGRYLAFRNSRTQLVNVETGEVLSRLNHDISNLWDDVEPQGFSDGSTFFILSESRVIFVDVPSGEVAGATLNFDIDRIGWAADSTLQMIQGEEEMAADAWWWSMKEGVSHLQIDDIPELITKDTLKFMVPFVDREDTLTLSPDGSMQAASDNHGGCGDGPYGGGCFFDTVLFVEESQTDVVLIEREGQGGTAIAWTPDSRSLAIGMEEDEGIVILDPFSGEQYYSFKGYLGYVRGLAFSPDGSMLASASEDGTIIVWRVP